MVRKEKAIDTTGDFFIMVLLTHRCITTGWDCGKGSRSWFFIKPNLGMSRNLLRKNDGSRARAGFNDHQRA